MTLSGNKRRLPLWLLPLPIVFITRWPIIPHPNNDKIMSDYVSQVKTINASQEAVYNKISNLSNLSALKERMSDPAATQQLSEQFGEDKIGAAMEYLQNVSFTPDTIEVGGTPVGALKLQIVEREEPKCVKLEGVGTPIPLTVWLQIVNRGEQEAAIRVTLRAELNFFMRQIVGKHLQQAADGLAEILSKINYTD